MFSGSYAFIYDDCLNDRRYERVLAELDVKLTSLDLEGRVARLALFRSAKDLIERMVREGVTTIVIVGNDQSLDKMMWFLPDLNITLGYLPLAEPWDVAGLLGIPTGLAACDVLAARFVETIDMGKIDDRYFLTQVRLDNTVAAINVEGRYRVSPMFGGSIEIRNLRYGSEVRVGEEEKHIHGLEVQIIPTLPNESKKWRSLMGLGRVEISPTRMHISHGEIISPDPIEVQVDHHRLNGFRFQISSVPQKLRIITGRGRKAPVASTTQGQTRQVSRNSMRGKVATRMT